MGQQVENQIMTRKGEVEKLIQDMKSANLESLTISPPEESKTFLEGELEQTFKLFTFTLHREIADLET